MMAVLLVLAAAASWAGETPRVGDTAPSFELQTLAGDSIELVGVLGRRATLVLFGATWSPRSTEALADYQALYAQHGDGALAVVAVNAKSQAWSAADADAVRAVVAKQGLTFPVVVDTDLSVLRVYGIAALPSSVLIDATGTVVKTLDGYPRTLRTELRKAVRQVLEGGTQAAPVRSSDGTSHAGTLKKLSAPGTAAPG